MALLSSAELAILNNGGSITLMGPAKAPSPPVIVPPVGSELSIRVVGNKFADAAGKLVQLRGVNISGLEFVAIQGWSPLDPWGGGAPNFAAIKAWKCNVVRLPFNAASWLGLTTYDADGKARDADPGRNYQATLKKAVDDATAAGMRVILDLHWAAPKLAVPGQAAKMAFSPLAQGQFADLDTSIGAWESVATRFKSYANVMFELFNEPFLDSWGPTIPADVGAAQLKGGSAPRFPNATGSGPYQIDQTWTIAGFQSMVDAIRATGATNVILISDRTWAQDLSHWLNYLAVDPLKQIGAVWHCYPHGVSPYTSGDVYPKTGVAAGGAAAYQWTDAILKAGYPVILTELGGHNAAGTHGEAFISAALKWVDSSGASVLGWTWNVWQDADNVLIKDAAGTPTDGWGQVYHDWMVGHA